jgi:hypothetical protein
MAMATQNAGFPTGEPTQAAVSTAAALAASTVLAPKDLLPIPLFSSHATPPFFQNLKPRRGKWTREEDRYAEFLIQEFELGSLEGCENGCTLRAFLSRKLHCAPMRISKKFAGTFYVIYFSVKESFQVSFLSSVKLTHSRLVQKENLLESLHFCARQMGQSVLAN